MDKQDNQRTERKMVSVAKAEAELFSATCSALGKSQQAEATKMIRRWNKRHAPLAHQRSLEKAASFAGGPNGRPSCGKN